MDLLQSVGSTALADPYRPSFFELFAQEQMRDLLAPALRYVLSVLAQRHPRWLLRIVNRFDELYALGMYAVERHYLNTWGSSFAENFYGLRRRRRPGISTDRAKAATAGTTRAGQASYEALRGREVSLSLLFLVGLPYAQAKAKDRWEQMGGGVSDEQLFDDGPARAASSRAASWRDRAAEVFRKGYPYASSVYQLWLLVYHVRYLFGKSPYWRPWLRWMRVDVRRVAHDDYPDQLPILPPNLPHPLREPGAFALAMVRSSPHMFFEALRYALPASIFFFKFLEWWYSADNPRRRRGGGGGSGGDGGGTAPAQGGFGTNVPLFGPPAVLLPAADGVLYSKPDDYKSPLVPSSPNDGSPRLLHNSCPLCGRTPVANPCMLPTGYVFCYTCAHAYVDEHGTCPLTHEPIPGGKESVRRVLG